jgi:hypothetical protein
MQTLVRSFSGTRSYNKSAQKNLSRGKRFDIKIHAQYGLITWFDKQVHDLLTLQLHVVSFARTGTVLQKVVCYRGLIESRSTGNARRFCQESPAGLRACVAPTIWLCDTVPSARLTLYSTKLCTTFNIFRKRLYFSTKVTSEAFLSIPQILKVTYIQGCTETKV